MCQSQTQDQQFLQAHTQKFCQSGSPPNVDLVLLQLLQESIFRIQSPQQPRPCFKNSIPQLLDSQIMVFHEYTTQETPRFIRVK